MKEIKANHYIDTVIYSVDMILRVLKSELKQKIDNLKIGITGEQFIVLDTICCYKDIYQQKLSEIVMKDKSNMTRILRVLEDKQLIKREIGSVNNRLVYFLRPTNTGKNVVEDNMPKIKVFITEIFENIEDEEIELLHKLSGKFQKDLSKLSDKF
jgi:DNA-binding MarR family transcriptional regulator